MKGTLTVNELGVKVKTLLTSRDFAVPTELKKAFLNAFVYLPFVTRADFGDEHSIVHVRERPMSCR